MSGYRAASLAVAILVGALTYLAMDATREGGSLSTHGEDGVDLSSSSIPAPLTGSDDSSILAAAASVSLKWTRQHCGGLVHIPVAACRFSYVRRRPPLAPSRVIANEGLTLSKDNGSRWSCMRCPSKGSPYRTIPQDNTGRDSEIHTSKVVSKYTTYAARCAANHGIMWARLLPGMHRRIMQRTVGMLLNLEIPPFKTAPTSVASLRKAKVSFSSQHHNDELVKPRQLLNGTRRQLHVLDFGSGCGVTLPTLEKVLAEFIAFHGRDLVEQSLGFLLPEKPPLVRGLGIDLIEAGIVYSNATYRSPSRLFCQADGSRLPWVPDRMFDWVVSLGSASLLPNAVRCSVVRMLLSEKLRPRGAMWLGYVPGNVACDFFCFDSDDDDSANLRHLCHNQLKTRSLRHETDVAQRPQSVAAQSKTSGEIEKNAGPIGILTNSSSSGSDTIVMATTTTTISLLKEQALWKGLRIHRYYQGEYSMVWKKAPERG